MKSDFSPESRSSGGFRSYHWCSPAPRASWRTEDGLHTCGSAARPPPSSASWWSDDNRSPETSPSRARRPPGLHGTESQTKWELPEVFQCSCLCVYQGVFYLSDTSLLRNPANTDTSQIHRRHKCLRSDTDSPGRRLHTCEDGRRVFIRHSISDIHTITTFQRKTEQRLPITNLVTFIYQVLWTKSFNVTLCEFSFHAKWIF